MRWLLALFCLSFVTVSQATAMEPLDGKVIEKSWFSSLPINCN